jgi:hypothetical protein
MSWLPFIAGCFDLPTVISKQRAQLQLCEKKNLGLAALFLKPWYAIIDTTHRRTHERAGCRESSETTFSPLF